jgi:O-methyltransferase/8-demethyl-8-(2,3-dimethoxy-alpha-L-rhamnosyl)tetracenomycin-C 4'-O-methyltransferase
LLRDSLTGKLYRDPPMDPWTPVYSDAVRDVGGDWPATALTMIGTQRLDQLRDACLDVLDRDVPGHFVETGVWRGGALVFMAGVLQVHRHPGQRQVYGCDSFRGLPPPSAEYPADAGDVHASYPQLVVGRQTVRENVNRWGVGRRVLLWPGWFKESLPALAQEVSAIAVLRLDGDMYQSTIEALTALYPKVSPGGYVIVDDYNLPGARKAADDYRTVNGIRSPLHPIDGAGVWWVKDGSPAG